MTAQTWKILLLEAVAIGCWVQLHEMQVTVRSAKLRPTSTSHVLFDDAKGTNRSFIYLQPPPQGSPSCLIQRDTHGVPVILTAVPKGATWSDCFAALIVGQPKDHTDAWYRNEYPNQGAIVADEAAHSFHIHWLQQF